MCAHLLNVSHSAAVKVCLECKKEKEKAVELAQLLHDGRKNGGNVKTAHSSNRLCIFRAGIHFLLLFAAVDFFFLPSFLFIL